jgi:hypothetical protein
MEYELPGVTDILFLYLNSPPPPPTVYPPPPPPPTAIVETEVTPAGATQE